MDMLPTRVVTHMQRRKVHVMDIVVLAVESQVRAVDLDLDQAAAAVVLLENLTSIHVHGEVGQVGHRPMSIMILHLANLAKVDMARRLVNLAKVALVI